MKAFDKFLDVLGFSEVQEEMVYEENETITEHYPEWKAHKKKAQVIPFTANKEINKVVLLEPFSFDDCQLIADHLKGKKIIILNLENIEIALARRIIDFVGGTAYALGGCLQKVGAGIIVVTPSNVDVTGDLNSVSQPKDVLAWINKITQENI